MHSVYSKHEPLLHGFLTFFLLLSTIARAQAADQADPCAPPTSYQPVAYYLGSAPSIDGLSNYTGSSPIVLDSTSPVLTLDYGQNFAGYPFLELSALSGAADIELKYSEQYVSTKPSSVASIPFWVLL
jgi:hypothetical protein